MTLTDLCDRQWRRDASRIAIVEPERSLTFGDVLAWSEGVSRALGGIVRRPGQRVALFLPNGAEFVAAFFGAARLGAVVAPLNPAYRRQELVYHLGDLEPAAVVTSPALAADLEPVAAALDRPPAIVVAEAAGVEVRRAGTGGAPALAGGASPPLLQQYTSGSTGTPKRIVRSHADLVHELGALREVFGLTEADRVLGVTPFSHVNGLVRTMMTSMSCGARLYPPPHFLRRRVLALLARERLTFFGGVPYMFAILAETAGDDGADLSALRVVFSSSAPLTPADGERFLARYGVAVRQLYGSTETGTIAFNRDADPRATMRSVGTPLPGVRISVVDDADRPVPPGREGQVVVASPFAASGYLGDPDASRLAFRDAGCRSGDLGILNSGGALTLTGRTRLVINRGGFKVNPYEVEDAIRSHPSVRDVAVFGAPTAHGDETVCCVIVPGRPCSPEDIVVHCRDRIADFKIPTWISFADALPRSATGKVLRARLAAAV